jgi:hypothetical protein
MITEMLKLFSPYIQLKCLFLFLLNSISGQINYFNGLELIADNTFTHGFNVYPACNKPDASIHHGALDPNCTKIYSLKNPFSCDQNQTAIWMIAQWGSHSSLPQDAINYTEDLNTKGVQWITADKSVVLFQDSRIRLEADAYHEYGGKYRDPNSPWAHLLIQQDIGISRGSLPLSQVNELYWSLNIRLDYMDQHIQPGYNINYYAAVFPLYLMIQNLNRSHPEYGKFVWLGITLYDDRAYNMWDYINGDSASQSLIYCPSFTNFASASVQDGGWVYVSGDMMPFVNLALQTAVNRSFFKSDDLSNFYVANMNMGWEMFGLNNGAIEVAQLSLKQYTPQNPKSFEFNKDKDTEGWTRKWDLGQQTDGPLNGIWVLLPIGDDPQLLSPILNLDASVVKRVVVRALNSPGNDDQMQLFWSSTSDDNSFSEEASCWIQIPSDGVWGQYILDPSNNTLWKNTIRRLRLDPVRAGNGSLWELDHIRFAV